MTAKPTASDSEPAEPPAPPSAKRSGRPRASRRRAAATAKGPRSIDLALQGGGSHGAFTWGVLDALLEDGRLSFDGVSGTSAGAMNAAVLACGHARGGREGARKALWAFWNDVSLVPGCLGEPPTTPLPVPVAVPVPVPVAVAPSGADLPSAQPLGTPAANAPAVAAPAPQPASGLSTWPFAPLSGQASPVSWPTWFFNPDTWPLYGVWDAVWRVLSPYQFNPLNLNPLRHILERHVDPALLRDGPLKVFVTATAVSTGQPKVFSGAELSVDALLASACLPQISQAIEIDGEAYWDGGYAGNPSLWPLIYGTESLDVLLVQINPLVRPGKPVSAVDIADRINEITFNASLVAEMRAISFVQRLIRERQLPADEYKSLRLHRVADEEGLAPFGASSKLNTDPRFLEVLFRLGRAAGRKWLAEHGDDVGVRGSVDIAPVFLAPRHAPATPPQKR